MNTEYLLGIAAKAKSPEEPDYDKFCFTFDEDELSRLIEIVKSEHGTALSEIRSFAQKQCDADTDEAILWAKVVSMATPNAEVSR